MHFRKMNKNKIIFSNPLVPVQHHENLEPILVPQGARWGPTLDRTIAGLAHVGVLAGSLARSHWDN